MLEAEVDTEATITFPPKAALEVPIGEGSNLYAYPERKAELQEKNSVHKQTRRVFVPEAQQVESAWVNAVDETGLDTEDVYAVLLRDGGMVAKPVDDLPQGCVLCEWPHGFGYFALTASQAAM